MDEEKPGNRKYTKEFKLEALALLASSGKSSRQIERELGITPGLLVKWRDRYQVISKGGRACSSGVERYRSCQARDQTAAAAVSGSGRRARNITPALAGGAREKNNQHFLPEKRMRYVYIREHRGEFSVKRMCQLLDVTRSGYYAWHPDEMSRRATENQVLVEHIRQAYKTSRQTYGSPRIRASLLRKGIACGRHRVARLMRREGIHPQKRQRWHPGTTRRQAGVFPAPNKLNQDFSATKANTKWVSDLIYIDTAEGWLYLAIVVDLFSRKVVGWAMAEQCNAALVETALRMALHGRQPGTTLLHHSDQGSQYTSAMYQSNLLNANIQMSMSRVGNCYDNAVAESFFATLKRECAIGQFATHTLARTTIFEYIEAWYNRQRLHSTLGYLSPLEFEQQHGH